MVLGENVEERIAQAIRFEARGKERKEEQSSFRAL